MSTVAQDVRYAFRLLRRSPGFTASATLTLALAIGANAAIFSAVHGVMIAPLPYADPDRLVRLFEEAPTVPHFPVSPADFRDYRSELRTFEGIAAYLRADLQLGDSQRPEHLRGMQVTSGFFKLLGHPPALGREFEPYDELDGNGDVVILSHSLWLRRFNGDPAVVGRAVRMSGRMLRVVGVLPRGFAHVGGTYRTYGHGEPVDVWTVLTVPREEKPALRFSHYFNVVGRVRRDVSAADIQQDLRTTGASIAKRFPGGTSPWTPRAVPLKTEIVGSAEPNLLLLAAAACGVLLLACVNVAGLLLGRAWARTREIGVRSAIGATRWRLVNQLLIESVVLAAAGGVLGVAFAYVAVSAIVRFGPADIPRLSMIEVNAPVLLFSVAATLLSALVFGLAPAARLARVELADALKEGARTVSGSSQRGRRLLAGIQMALAFVLVVSSGLLLRSFVAVLNSDAGFQTASVLTASIELPTARYSTEAARSFFDRAAERMRALPGIRGVTFTSDLPWTNYDENTGFSIVGRKTGDADEPEARYHFISDGYTRATGTRLAAGRDLRPSDRGEAARVVLINEAAARKYWGTAQAAIGARLDLWGEQRTVAGVIGDVRDLPWQERAVPALYFPVNQEWQPQTMFLVARSAGATPPAADSISRVIKEIDPELPLADVRPLEAVAGAALAARRLTLWLVGAFGVTALLLAVLGIYGVLAQAVGQRAHEFGVRQALGATRGDIMRLVISSGAVMTISGLAAGVALSVAATRLLASVLYGVTPLDPVTFVSVAALILAAAAAAAYVPARRATRISAAASLRSAM